MDILSIKDMSFGYGNNNILRNIDLNIKNGEFVGLVGANGSGKSTLLKLILGQIKPKSGSIKINNSNIFNKKNVGIIGYVPQMVKKTELAFPITPEEIIGLNIFNKKKLELNKQIETSLKIVNLFEKRKYNYNNMSGGEQQRVMIAKALANNPDFIIMDEPTSGIDEESKKILFQILDHLNKSHNITILIVTHELEYVRSYLTKLLVLKKGKIREIKE